MSEPTALSEQVLELEIRVAYQDRKVAALDEVVRTFTARVEELERQGRSRSGSWDNHEEPERDNFRRRRFEPRAQVRAALRM